MKQHINLFARLPQVKVDTGKHNVKKMLWASVTISILYTFYALYIHIHGDMLNEKLEHITADKKTAQQVYDDTSAKYPAETKTAIAKQDKDIESHIAVKNALLTLLQSSSLSTEGFSKKMEALSKTVEPGMWLTTIEFNLTDDYVGFAGMSVSVEALLKFVDNIGRNEAFGGKKFSTFKMDNPPDDGSSLFSFVLSNHASREPVAPSIASLAPEPKADENNAQSAPAQTDNPIPAPNTNTLPSSTAPAAPPSSVFMPDMNDEEAHAKGNGTANNPSTQNSEEDNND